MIQPRPRRNRGNFLKSKQMKYFLFLFGLYLACNEAFDLQTAFIGLGLMGIGGLLIVERIKEFMKAE